MILDDILDKDKVSGWIAPHTIIWRVRKTTYYSFAQNVKAIAFQIHFRSDTNNFANFGLVELKDKT